MKNSILLILCVLLTQCDIFWECDGVLPKAVPLTGDQLKTNGYYYQFPNTHVVRPYFLYDNGMLLDAGGSATTLEEMDAYIMKNYIRDNWHKKNKYVWGVLFIDNNNIRIHRLNQDYPHRENVREGIILNDTTFQLTQYTSGNNVSERNEIYHFREFYPKPDSTNKYIK